MNEFKIEKNISITEILNLIFESGKNEINLQIEEGSHLLDSKINLSLVFRLAKEKGIKLSFESDSDHGKGIIRDVMLENSDSEELNIDRYLHEETHSYKTPQTKQTIEKKFELPNMPSLPNISLQSFSFDLSFLKNNKLFPILIIFWTVLLIGGYFYINSSQKAEIEIFVQAERFVKSLEVRLSTVKASDVENKIFKGEPYIQQITIIEEVETSGKIDSGKKARGEVTLTNKTDEELDLKKGSKIEFKSGGKELVFLTLSDLKIPARVVESTSPNVYVNSTKTFEVEAFDFGSSFNLEANKEVTLDGKSSDLVSGVVTKAITGGSKNDIKAVSSQDITNVYDKALEKVKSGFVPNEEAGKVFLRGSEQFTVLKTDYSAKAGDAADRIKITLVVEARGLRYDIKDAENYVKASMKNLLPSGFEVYGKDLEVEINLLGNTNSTTLTKDEGDVQVTVKTYSIPVLNTNEIKSSLLGKNLTEAEQLIKNIPNVIKYNIEFNYPILNTIPTDLEKVNVTVSKE